MKSWFAPCGFTLGSICGENEINVDTCVWPVVCFDTNFLSFCYIHFVIAISGLWTGNLWITTVNIEVEHYVILCAALRNHSFALVVKHDDNFLVCRWGEESLEFLACSIDPHGIGNPVLVHQYPVTCESNLEIFNRDVEDTIISRSQVYLFLLSGGPAAIIVIVWSCVLFFTPWVSDFHKLRSTVKFDCSE